MPTAVIVDMDGTLCDVSSALHHLHGPRKDFHAFHEATRHCPSTHWVIEWCADRVDEGHAIFVVTARKYQHESLTREWLGEHFPLPYQALLMRGDHDDRSDDEVKLDILRIIREDYGYEVVRAIDDRPRVIRLWKSQGIPCDVVYRSDWEQVGESYGDLIDEVKYGRRSHLQ